MGCGGRGGILHADVIAGRVVETRERFTACRREMLSRTAKSCGPDASTPASSQAEAMSAQPGADVVVNSLDDGDKKARSPGRSRRKPLKPLRAGMPGCCGVPVVTTLVWFIFSHARLRVRWAPGIPHTLCLRVPAQSS